MLHQPSTRSEGVHVKEGGPCTLLLIPLLRSIRIACG